MNHGPLIVAGIILGVGMGGFIDGILFQQILQAHSMLSATLPPDTLVNVQVNMVWDGFFHLFSLAVTAIGLAALWRAGRMRDVPWSGWTFFGSLVAGWGLFNIVEGVIAHYILGIHHVIEAVGLSIYDHAFVTSGVLFSLAGWGLIRAGAADEIVRHPAPAYR